MSDWLALILWLDKGKVIELFIIGVVLITDAGSYFDIGGSGKDSMTY